MNRRRPLAGDRLAGELERRGLDVVRRLRGMVRLLLQDRGLSPEAEERLAASLRCPLDPAADPDAAVELVTSLVESVRTLASREQAYQPGRVHCFRCESSECEHARPDDSEEIFAGYTATGRPHWVNFVSWCLDRRLDKVGGLLAGRNLVLAEAVSEEELCREQLDLFGAGDPDYRILGQVTAGFFPMRLGEEAFRAALSLQVVRLRGGDGRPRTVLNPVGAVPVSEYAEPGLIDILAESRKQLDLLSIRLEGLENSGHGGEAGELVGPFLRALVRDLEQHARGEIRRTGHAKVRSRQGKRPTEMAYPDARNALDEDLLVDTLEATMVVLGPRGRVHVFSRDGRHVTSLRYPGDALRRRQQTGRWRAADPPERGAFRAALRALERDLDPRRDDEEPPEEGGR